MSRSDRLALLVLAAVGLPLLSLLFVTGRGWGEAASAITTVGLTAGLMAALRIRTVLSEPSPKTTVASPDPARRPATDAAADPVAEPAPDLDTSTDTEAGEAETRPDAESGAAETETEVVTDSEVVTVAGTDGPGCRCRAMLELGTDVFLVVDPTLTIVETSPTVERVVGHPPTALVGAPVGDLLDVAATRMLHQLASRPIDDLSGTILDVDVTTATGRTLLAELTIGTTGSEPDSDEPGDLLLALRDVTALRRLEESLRSRAVVDQPTGLLNRTSFEFELQSTLRRLPPDHLGAVVNLVVQDFGDVNDAVGFDGGTRLLIEVANRLRTALRGVDVLARLGEEEFAVAAIGPSLRSLRRFAERLAWVFEEPFEIDDHPHHLRVAVGMATTEDRWTEVDRLMQSASVAVHEAETRNSEEIVVYDQGLQDQIDERFELTSALRPALRNGEFHLVYQPLLSLGTGEVESFEALLRWDHPTLGPISPATFIPLAEKSGTIVELGRWVAEEACRQLVDWRERLDGYDRVSMGINLSARQLERHGELDALIYIVEGSGLDLPSLTVELTESAMIDDAGWIGSQLQHLRELGSRIAIDDFGTGVAGLSHLRELPYDVVKIDRSYIDKVGADPTGENLVGQIIDLARGLGAKSVAEGIETDVQAWRLAEMGCDIGQGFHLAKPMPADAIESWMGEHHARSTR